MTAQGTLQAFWQFLNTDIDLRAISKLDVADQAIALTTAIKDSAEVLQDSADQLPQLAPYLQQAAPLLELLDNPVVQVGISGLPFVSVGMNLLKMLADAAKVPPTFEGSVVIVAQIAYLESLTKVVARLPEGEIKAKLADLSLQRVVERQIKKVKARDLSKDEAKQVVTRFRESVLGRQFSETLVDLLAEVGLSQDQAQAQALAEQVGWGCPRYVHLALVEAGEQVEPLAEFYRTGGPETEARFASIDDYLRDHIATLPQERVFDEDFGFEKLYVQLQVQPLTQDGEVDRYAAPLCSHEWTRQVLAQHKPDKPRQVMFLEGNAGQGKSVFCRMVADRVRREFGDGFIPLNIRLRDLRNLEGNLPKTLTSCKDLQSADFVQSDSGWLTDKNTRFLIILDGFDELMLQSRDPRSLTNFLEYVVDFQKEFHHQCLITCRPLALQGVSPVRLNSKHLQRMRLEPMGDTLRKQWLNNWEKIFGEEVSIQFQNFLANCPKDISELAREPLLLYLLARLSREGELDGVDFDDNASEMQARVQIYRRSVDWVLNQQREELNGVITGLEDEELPQVWREAALCVVQSGNETAQIEMLKDRFSDGSNSVADLLKKSQEATGETKEKTLNNLLTLFYLKPGEGARQGSVEFVHKSFGEYLFAERLMVALDALTKEEDERERASQLYDLLGYGGLSQEIVAYLWELLAESDIDRVRLFKRLHEFYNRWHQGKFLDNLDDSGNLYDLGNNLPQKKQRQLHKQKIPTGLWQVDIFTGLNVMILLFKLHADAQPEGYPHLPEDVPKPDIYFHPCGDFGVDEIEDDQRDHLKRIIHYADALGWGTFTQVVGPHLRCTDLSGSNLFSANLFSADLNSAKLFNADLCRAILCGADLRRADLNNTNFFNADLSSASLFNAVLNNADLRKADLHRADLSRVIINGADLSSANLSSVNLVSANLFSVNLFSADLRRANMCQANLFSVNLFSADLRSANMYQADLNCADLINADLNNANLSYALLVETNLTATQNLTPDQFKGDTPPLLCNAALPDHISLDPNRDWDRLAPVLHERYPENFDTLEKAEAWVAQKRPH